MFRITSALIIAFASMLGSGDLAVAQQPARALRGTVSPLTLGAEDNGAVTPSTPLTSIHVYMTLSTTKSRALAQLLSDQRTPGSSKYHKWLTPTEFGSQFGVSSTDEQKVRVWLESEGFANIRLSASRTSFVFAGTAAQAQHAFQTSIHAMTKNGAIHFANVSDVSVPSTMAGLVQAVRGLDDFKPTPHAIKSAAKASPQYTVGAGAFGLAPNDIATIYDLKPLYAAGIDGSGVTVAVVGQSDIDLTNISAYRNGFNLPVNLPSVVLVPSSPDPGTIQAYAEEAYLDLEVLGAVARNTSLIYVNSSNVDDSFEYAVDNNIAQVISTSFGGCEPILGNAIPEYLYQQANAQGITIVAAAGDEGAADCDLKGAASATLGLAVDSPADVPEVTAVGGTSFATPVDSYFSGSNDSMGGSALSYIPEVAWNGTQSQGHLSAGGGGASALFTKPSWQQGTGVPADGMRDVPDVSMFSANDGYEAFAYIVCTDGDCASGPPNLTSSGSEWGGTSASAPVFAGIIALLNHYLITSGDLSAPGLGNVNPHLYLLAANATSVFHDITQGNNIVPCTLNTPDCTTGSFGYSAGVGYDQVTGLGTLDGYNLVHEWNSYSIVGTTASLSASASVLAPGASITLTAQVMPASGSAIPSGSVTFYSGDNSLGTEPLDSTGKASFTTNTLNYGVDSITAFYQGDLQFGQSLSSAVSITALVPTTTTITPAASTWPQGSPFSLSIAVVPSTGSTTATGTVTVYVGSTSLGSVTLSSGAAIFTTSALPVGTDSLKAVYSGDSALATSSSSVISVTILDSTQTITTTTTLTANPTQASQGTEVTLTAIVAPATGATLPTGTVAFYSGSTSLGTVTLSNGQAVFPTTNLPTGTDSLTATFTGSSNYAASTSAVISVIVTASQPDFSMAASPAALTVTGGQTATTTLTVTPSNGFIQSLAFACSGLPTGSTCSFGTPTVQTNGTTTVTLSMSTTVLSAALARPVSSSTPLFAVLPFIGILSFRRRKAIIRALQLGIVAFALVVIGAGMTGCSGGGAGTNPSQPTPVTSTITVTATPQSGTAQTTQISLTVK
jgi:hypothetical protein